jgi:hypothetical protein
MHKFKFRLLVALVTFGVGVFIAYEFYKTYQSPAASQTPLVESINPSSQTEISHKADNNNDLPDNSYDPAKNLRDKGRDFPDFQNFKYPRVCEDRDNTSFLMKDGRYEDKENKFLFAAVKYTDVTGDNKEEAIVFIDIVSGGSSLPGCVYIFQSQEPKNKKVKLIWEFFAGDRAFGGLRNIYNENEQLVVETYFAEESDAACCPSSYFIEKYKWQGNKFRRINRTKVINTSRKFEPQTFK